MHGAVQVTKQSGISPQVISFTLLGSGSPMPEPATSAQEEPTESSRVLNQMVTSGDLDSALHASWGILIAGNRPDD